jgi:hypothetical protein
VKIDVVRKERAEQTRHRRVRRPSPAPLSPGGPIGFAAWQISAPNSSAISGGSARRGAVGQEREPNRSSSAGGRQALAGRDRTADAAPPWSRGRSPPPLAHPLDHRANTVPDRVAQAWPGPWPPAATRGRRAGPEEQAQPAHRDHSPDPNGDGLSGNVITSSRFSS